MEEPPRWERIKWCKAGICLLLLLNLALAREMDSEQEKEKEREEKKASAEGLAAARLPADPSKGADGIAENTLEVYDVLDFGAEASLLKAKGLSFAKPSFADVPTPKEEDAFEPKNREAMAAAESEATTFSDTPAEPTAVVAEEKEGVASANVGSGWVRTGLTNSETMKTAGTYVSISDVALCSGNGYVLQGVNGAFTIYDTDGALLSGPVPFPNYIDPRCIYDAENKRFYFIAAQRGGKPGGYHANVLVGVSQSENATDQWNLYSIDVASVEDGPSKCMSADPCFADYPTLGQDKNGIWIAANLWTSGESEFAGAKVWGLSKQALMSGSPVTPIAFYNFNPPFMFLQPASPQGNTTSIAENGGTTYLVTSGSLENLVLWKLTETERLHAGAVPDIALGKYLASQKLEEPHDNAQQNGVKVNMGEWEVSTASQVGDKLYMMASTGLGEDKNETRGLAWYVVDPEKATVESQGVIGLPGWNLFNPALTGSPSGNMAFVAQTAGSGVPGVASVFGTIDGTTGQVTSFRFLDGGPNGTFPVAISDVEELRTGDYSAIQLGEDGFVYASSQQTQTLPDVNGSYNWGTAIWGKQEL